MRRAVAEICPAADSLYAARSRRFFRKQTGGGRSPPPRIQYLWLVYPVCRGCKVCGFNLVQSVPSLGHLRLQLRLFLSSGGVALCTEGTFFFDVDIPGLPFDVCSTWWNRYSLQQQQQRPMPPPPNNSFTSSIPASVCVMPCDFSIKFYHFNASSQGRNGSVLCFLAASVGAQVSRHLQNTYSLFTLCERWAKRN